MKNPKEKGNSFERLIANKLSVWAGAKFMRTPSSGAIHNFKDKRIVSDIVPSLSIGDFPFSIECKKVQCSWEINALLEGTSITLQKHWSQCVSDAEREELKPLLIFSKNYRGIYTMIREEDFAYYHITVFPRLIICTTIEELTIFNFEDFLTSTSITQLVSHSDT